MEWNKKLATGVDEYDKMYPVMIENVNMLLRMMAACRTAKDYSKNLDAIKMEFVDMFAYQENRMLVQKYPQYYQHKHHHEQLLERLDAVYDSLSLDYVGSTAAQVENLITNWVMQHIFLYDKLWGQYTIEEENSK